MREKIEHIFETDIRPMLAMHGGNIELLGVDEATGVVRVRLHGACRGCPMSTITLRMGVEAALVDAVPGVTEVVAVDDDVI